jgi:hypothetical protein
MPKTVSKSREERFSFSVPAELRAAFEAATQAEKRPAAEVLRDFMRAYVAQPPQSDAEYEAWFRARVQAAIDDPRPSIPHDIVMKRTRAIVDRMAATKPALEN